MHIYINLRSNKHPLGEKVFIFIVGIYKSNICIPPHCFELHLNFLIRLCIMRLVILTPSAVRHVETCSPGLGQLDYLNSCPCSSLSYIPSLFRHCFPVL